MSAALARGLGTLAGLAGLALAGLAAAREAPPPLGTPQPFVVPAKSETQLDNGLKVTWVPFGSVPKTTLMLVVATGNIDDGQKTGLADLSVELMKQGAGARDAQTLARYTAEMGGALEFAAGLEQSTLTLDVLEERAADALTLIADVVRRPQLPVAQLPRLKADLARQSAIARSQAQALAGEAYAKLLFGDSPYGREIPTDAEIASIGLADVQAFAASQFGAARSHLYVGGRFDRAALERSLTAGFGDWATGTAPARHPPEGAHRQQLRLIDRPGAAQSTILMGLPAPGTATPGFIQLSVANVLFGGTLLSRLDQNLREDKGYAYGASSRLTPYSGFCAWTIATDVNAPDTDKALEQIYAELARLRSEAPPADELTRIQNYRAGTFVLGASSRAGLLAQLAFIDQQGLPPDWLTSYVARLHAVTPEQVRAAASRYLDPQAMTLVVVGDLKTIKPGILALPALKDVRSE